MDSNNHNFFSLSNGTLITSSLQDPDVLVLIYNYHKKDSSASCLALRPGKTGKRILPHCCINRRGHAEKSHNRAGRERKKVISSGATGTFVNFPNLNPPQPP
jgi:hypothetical protein